MCRPCRAAGPLRFADPLPAGRRTFAHARSAELRRSIRRPPRRLLPPGARRDRRSSERDSRCSRSSTSSSTSTRARARRGTASCTRSTACRSRSRRASSLGLVGESGQRQEHRRELRHPAPRADERDGPAQGPRHHAPGRRELRPLRREMHMVFQDPYSSLDPRMTCGQIVGEPLRLQRARDADASSSARRGALRPGRACAPSCASATRTSCRAGSVSASGSRGRSPCRRAARRRRTGLGARRLRAGVDPQPAQRPAGGSRLLVPVHHARPRDRRVPLRPRRRHVPRQDRRDRTDPGAVHRARAPVHPGAALGGSRPRSGDPAEPRRGRARGRHPEPDRPAVGLPVPHAVPARASLGAGSHEVEPELVQVGPGHHVACHLVGRGGFTPP